MTDGQPALNGAGGSQPALSIARDAQPALSAAREGEAALAQLEKIRQRKGRRGAGCHSLAGAGKVLAIGRAAVGYRGWGVGLWCELDLFHKGACLFVGRLSRLWDWVLFGKVGALCAITTA